MSYAASLAYAILAAAVWFVLLAFLLLLGTAFVSLALIIVRAML